MPSSFGGCGAANKPSAADWAEWCYGAPYTWSSRYWDGTPQMAYNFYTTTAKLIKQKYPGIQVGGPAAGTSTSFFACGDLSQTSIGMTWIRGFLEEVKKGDAPLDFFSFHFYGQGQGQRSDMAPVSEIYFSFLEAISAVGGFGPLPIAVTEWNAPCYLANISAHVGSLAGAASNAAKIAFWVKQPRIHAAFIYDGLSGAFEPRNPYSFPLDCSAKVKEPASNCSACLADLVRGGTTIPPTALPDFAATVVSSEPHCGCGP